jgi:hypothetical protein
LNAAVPKDFGISANKFGTRFGNGSKKNRESGGVTEKMADRQVVRTLQK